MPNQSGKPKKSQSQNQLQLERGADGKVRFSSHRQFSQPDPIHTQPATGATSNNVAENIHNVDQQIRDQLAQLRQSFEQQNQLFFQLGQVTQLEAQMQMQQQQGQLQEHPWSILLEADLRFLCHCFIPTHNKDDVDLDSASATSVPKMCFTSAEEYKQDILLMSVTDVANLVIEFKRWLFTRFVPKERRARGVLRMEWLGMEELWDLMVPGKQSGFQRKGLEAEEFGWLVYAPAVATLPGYPGIEHTVMGLIVPGSSGVRWFYHCFEQENPLKFLAEEMGYVRLRKVVKVGGKEHKRWQAFIRNAFGEATGFPDSKDWKNAVTVTDYCPEIEDEEEAVRLLEGNKMIYDMKHDDDVALREGRDGEGRMLWEPSDDRYLEELPVAERMIVGMTGYKCSEYLLIKRVFFKAFWEDIHRSDKKIATAEPEDEKPFEPLSRQNSEAPSTIPTTPAPEDATSATATPTATPASNRRRSTRPRNVPSLPNIDSLREDTPLRSSPAQSQSHLRGWQNRRRLIRTTHAHEVWLQNEFGMKQGKSKIIVAAWRTLGFLDEEWFGEWVRNAGLFEFGDGVGGGAREVG